MQAVGRGGDPARSLEDVTGLSLTEIERALRRHLRGSMPYVRLTYEIPEPTFEIATLPASADDLLLLNQALKTSSTPERRAQLPGLVRAAAARHPDDLLARRALGHAELHIATWARTCCTTWWRAGRTTSKLSSCWARSI
jgi:hypothetical protein